MEILKGFVWDLQRHAGIAWGTAGTYYWSSGATIATSLDISTEDWVATDEPAADSTSGNVLYGVTLDSSGAITKIFTKTSTGTAWGAEAAYANTSTVTDSTNEIESNLIFADASKYVLAITKAKGNVTVTTGFSGTDSVHVVSGKTASINGTSYTPGTSGATLAGDNSTGVKLIGGGVAISSPSTTVEIPYGGNAGAAADGTVSVKGTGTVNHDGTVTGVGSGSTITSTGAVTTSAATTGSYTVNGISFSKTEASGDSNPLKVTVGTADPVVVTLDNDSIKAEGDTFTITGNTTSKAVTVANSTGTVTFTEVSTGVTFTGDGTSMSATLDAANESVTLTKKVTLLSSGAVTIDRTGKLSGLGLGESVQVGDYTLVVSKNSSNKTVITQTDNNGNTAVFQFVDGASTVDDIPVQTFTGLNPADEANIVKYTPDTKYAALSNGGTATLLSTLENTGELVFASTASNTGTKYATLTRVNDTTYTLAYTTNISSFTNGVTVDASALPSSATLTVTPSGSPDVTYYKTANGTVLIKASDVGTKKTFTLTGDIVNMSTADSPTFSLTSGYIKTGAEDNTVYTINTSGGTFTLDESTGAGNTTATKITSAGAFTDVDANGKVTLAENRDADSTATTAFSVNGTAYTAVSEKGAEIELDGDGVAHLEAGSIVVSASSVNVGSTAVSVKVTGGDGAVISATGGALGMISDLENGETVTVVNTGAAGAAGDAYKTVYTVTNGVLSVSEYYLATTTVPVQKNYVLTGDSISATASVPTTGEYETTTTYTATFGVKDSESASQDVAEGKSLYIQKDGSTSLTSDSKTVGTLSATSEMTTYEAASGSKAQTITVGDNRNNDATNWSITGTGNADTITYGATSDATINAGAGKDTVNLNSTGDVVLNAGDGANTINLNGTGNYTVTMGNGKNTVNASGAGEYVITTGSGGSEITRTGGTAVNGNATITGGAGKDTIKAAGADDVVRGGDGADTFDVTSTSITISDYVYGTDVLEASAAGTAPAITASNFGADGVVTIGAVTADVSAGTNTGDFYAVSLVDGNGKNKVNVGFAKESGSTVDVQSITDNVVLIGQNNDEAGDALYSGSGKDTIFGGSNDSVYGGAGKDSISLTGTGVVVGVSTTMGKDSVTGFATGFEDADSLFMVDGSASDVSVSFASNTVTFKDGDGSLQINNVSAASTGAVELLVGSSKLAVAAENGTITTDNASYADYYIGKNSAVNFASVGGGLNVDLRNGLDSSESGLKFSGITAVTGGEGKNTLIGSTGAEYLSAGTGDSSLWGGAGKDTLVGGTGRDVFYIGSGDGSDVVTRFAGASSENADTVYTLANITGAKNTGSAVEISVSDTDKITLQNVSADTAIKVNANGTELVAKVGSASSSNSFSYDSSVTYYGGGSASDKITFSNGYTDSAQIWLDGSQGKAYASIDVVDGTNTNGSLIVAGDSSSQSIIGGKGDTSLWGGAGNATDTLRSSSTGKTMFWWGTGEGNDVVVSASANDSVNLYNLKLSDVDVANSSITNSGVSLALNDGSKLTVQTGRDMNFTIDGQSWTAQHNSKTWKQNS